MNALCRTVGMCASLLLALAGATRSALLPDVPTIDEAAGMRGVAAGSWLGLLAPAGTPRHIIARLNEVAVQAVRAPETRARLIGQGSDPVGNSPRAFAAFIRAEYDKNGAAVKQSGFEGRLTSERWRLTPHLPNSF